VLLQMFVKIEEIREGLELNEPITLGILEDALARKGEETGFRPLRESQLKASLRRVSGGVLLKAGFRVDVAGPCKRCLGEVAATIPVSFTLTLIPRSLVKNDELPPDEDDEESERAGSFDLQDADREWFDGKKIDLDPILREQVLLAVPMNLVCRETCRGLCPVCGENLNEKQCQCEREVVDPRWMALKNIKLN
jgi:uncharacterized protein